MGYNSTLVVLNDAIHIIKEDPKFGENVYYAIQELHRGKSVDISSGNFCNAAVAVEQHHSSHFVPVLVGGNYGKAIESASFGALVEDPELALLTTLALKRGYKLTKKLK